MKQPKSKKPRKQRKWLSEAPHHRLKKMVSALLSDELREKYNRRSLPVRKGDAVEVMRGSFKGVSGEVLGVKPQKQTLTVDGINIKKADGSDIPKPIAVSNVLITNLTLEDEKRREIIERKEK